MTKELPLCKCGCGRLVKSHWNRYVKGHHLIGKTLSEEHRRKINESNTNKKIIVHGPLSLCACGCGKVVTSIHNKVIKNHPQGSKKIVPVQGPLQLCACGCGKVVSHVTNKIIYHHKGWGKKLTIQGPLQLCSCGCGQVVKKVDKIYLPFHKPKNHNKVKVLETTSTTDVDCCRMCKSKNALERHHLVPRKYGVNNDEYNLIILCKNCHDKVEILTTDWIDSGKEYSAFIFRRLIVYIW